MSVFSIVRFSMALAVMFFCGTVFAVDNTEVKDKVQDPYYGVALWHYFQGENLEALTELMLAEKNGGIKGYGDEPRLMVAGLNLAYGMVDESRARFEELIDADTPKALKQTAWYYLAKLEYEQGDLLRAADAIERYQASLKESSSSRGWFGLRGSNDFGIEYIESAVSSLDFNILLQNAQYDPEKLNEATVLLDQKAFREADPILSFNLANAYSRQGQYDRAIRYFSRARDLIGGQSVVQKEDLQLIDKIYTAEGFAEMLRGNNLSAMGRFGEVQQESMSFPLALLGYGRAASLSGRYQSALGYLESLAALPNYEKGVVESRLSIAEIYEELEQPEQALERYRFAIQTYENDIVQIDQQIEFLNTENLDLLSLSDSLSNWLSQDAFIATPEPEFVRVFSENGFQTELRELQDLLSLNKVIADRIERLDMLNDILNERQGKRQQQQVQYQSMFLDEHLDVYEKQFNERRNEFHQVVEEGDYLAFISNDSIDLLARVKQSQKIIDSREAIADFIDDASMDDKADRIRTYNGLLLWQAAQDFSENAWKKQQELELAEVELNQLKELKTSVENILQTAPDFNPYFQRVEGMQFGANLLQTRLSQELDEAKKRTFSRLIAHLYTRKQNLRSHLTQARLALLRINEELGIAAIDQGGLR